MEIEGGGIEIKEIKIPRIGHVSRGLSGALGVCFVVIGLWAGGLFMQQESVKTPADVAREAVKSIAKAPEIPTQSSQSIIEPKTVNASKDVATPMSFVEKPGVVVQAPVKPKKAPSKSVIKPVTIKKNLSESENIFTQTAQESSTPETKTVSLSKSTGVSVPGAEQSDVGKIDFTIKARLGNTSNSKEIESAMRIYVEGKKMANFSLSLREPSQSVSARLKPGVYKYYIEGVSLWDSKSNPLIPMEGSGVIVVSTAGVFEVWAEAAPEPQTKVWEVKLKEK